MARDHGIAICCVHAATVQPANRGACAPPELAFSTYRVMSIPMKASSKFEGEIADRWSDETYANVARYLDHRADLVCSLGPPLGSGDTVLDLACGDGRLGELLMTRGMSYIGVDASVVNGRCGAAASRTEGTGPHRVTSMSTTQGSR